MSTRPPYAIRRAARKAKKIAAEDLGMTGKYLGNPTFSIEWVEPSEIGGNKGQVRGTRTHRIYLRNDLDPIEAVKTVFHEARHLERLRKGKFPTLQTRMNRAVVEREERIADGRMHYLWRKHRHKFENEPWFPDADT